LTYSIANGIGVGFISWSLIHVMSKRGRDVHWLLWVVSAGFVLYFVRGPISAMLGAWETWSAAQYGRRDKSPTADEPCLGATGAGRADFDVLHCCSHG